MRDTKVLLETSAYQLGQLPPADWLLAKASGPCMQALAIVASCREHSVPLQCTDAHRTVRVADLTARLSTERSGPQVLKVPSDIEYNGRGPLVSARLVDTDLLGARGEQVARLRTCQMCRSIVLLWTITSGSQVAGCMEHAGCRQRRQGASTGSDEKILCAGTADVSGAEGDGAGGVPGAE